MYYYTKICLRTQVYIPLPFLYLTEISRATKAPTKILNYLIAWCAGILWSFSWYTEHNYKRQSLGIYNTFSVLVTNDLPLVIISTLLCEADDTVICDWW